MSKWAQRAKAHFSQTRQNCTTETTESPCVFLQEHPKRTIETTETPLSVVLTVQSGRFREKHDFPDQVDAAANDPALTTTVQADLSAIADIEGKPTTPADSASGAVIDIGTVRPPGLTPALLAASLALDAEIQAAGQFDDNDETPDRWCYQSSTTMPGSEIDLFAARLARFIDKGVIHDDAESLADRLAIRDRDSDDRRLCLECAHLQGYGQASWRCGNWQAAGIATNPRSTQLAADLVFQLQRCAGLTHAFNPTPKAHHD